MVAGTATLATAIAGGAQVGMAVHGREVARAGERQAKRDQVKANETQAASASAQRARARRKAIAAQRVVVARNAAAATDTGIVGSSSQLGANASIASNLASSFASENRSFVTGQETLAARQHGANALAKGQRRAGDAAAVGGLFQTATSVGAGFI